MAVLKGWISPNYSGSPESRRRRPRHMWGRHAGVMLPATRRLAEGTNMLPVLSRITHATRESPGWPEATGASSKAAVGARDRRAWRWRPREQAFQSEVYGEAHQEQESELREAGEGSAATGSSSGSHGGRRRGGKGGGVLGALWLDSARVMTKTK